jgi:hypothetical protein
MKLHTSPIYFHKKGKGRYRPAPAETLAAAKAGQEKSAWPPSARRGSSPS